MPPPRTIDTVIVGNGPSALILSFILSGNIPYYVPALQQHPDPILHSKLDSCLLDIDVDDLTAHFSGSRLSYSTAALPINVLLDSLLRPLADTEPGAYRSCVEWRKDPSRAVPHVVLGDTAPGGQWASNPVAASWDIGTLSYADQLSLPGYSFGDHFKATGRAEDTEFLRPTRRDVAQYLAAYPLAVGIGASVKPPSVVSGIARTPDGFHVGSHDIACRHLVLASGIFSRLIPARPQLQPLLELSPCPDHDPPLLVVGSGFTAADVIITNQSRRKLIHIFKWDPEERPSPLRSCHPKAYPEYAGVYRRMKQAAVQRLGEDSVASPLQRRKSNAYFDGMDLDHSYEGFPNTYIQQVEVQKGRAVVVLSLADGETVRREISNLEYVIGRRGSLEYLDPALREEVIGSNAAVLDGVSKRTLRAKVEDSLEVAPDVFVVGSLAGDSLIRHTIGTCVFAAGQIIGRQHEVADPYKQTEDMNANMSKHSWPNGKQLSLKKGEVELAVGERRRCSFWSWSWWRDKG